MGTRGRWTPGGSVSVWGFNMGAALLLLAATGCSDPNGVVQAPTTEAAVRSTTSSVAAATTEQAAPGATVPSTTTTRLTSTTAPAPALPGTPEDDSVPPAPPTTVSSVAADESSAPAAEDDPDASGAPPEWLGTRPLELRPDGYGVATPTPQELVGRAFAPSTRIGPGGEEFEAEVGPVPPEVLARSTWSEACPVAVEDLSYLVLTFRGFDGASHLGEMIVASSVADDVVEVFRRLFESDFPIEEMRVIGAADLDAPRTGDGNTTSAFTCRPVTGSTSWSQHAYGLAIDLNPFHNPYRKGDLVLPELASWYLDRTLGLPGMIVEGGPVVEAFDAIGWGWGGRWRSLDDYHHFSRNGR